MQETTAIRISAGANTALGALGLYFGLWIDSDSILLDGAFNVISLGLALWTLKVATLIRRPADERFHFGYAFFEPFTNLVKSLLVLGVSLFAFAGAVDTILDGGHTVAAGPALAYAGVAVTACLVLAVIQSRAARRTESPLLAVDAKNWFVNAAVSSAVGIAFFITIFMEGTGWAAAIPYVDSMLVVVLVLVTLPLPTKMAGAGLAELLNMAPDVGVQEEVRQRFGKAAEGHGFAGSRLRMARIGRTFYVMATALVPGDRVAALDAIRNDIEGKLKPEAPDLVMDIVFTGEERRISGTESK